jgi:GNAT superfamily N-acetyltransferase
MTFADLELSRRLERAEGQSGKEFAEARRLRDPESGAAWMECAGAWAIFDGVESPVTQTFGLGLFEETTPTSLDEIERFFLSRGAPVIHEVSPFAGIVTLDLLCARGYRPIELSSVMHRPVESPASAEKSPAMVRIPGAEEAELWAELSAKGWASDYPELQETIQHFGRVSFSRAHSVCFLGEVDGRPGATGALSLHEGVALFAGASTIPEMRRRGLQTALLAARMRYAREQGCDLAMMVTAVGSQSQRNAERIGFRIAYTRTKWQLNK